MDIFQLLKQGYRNPTGFRRWVKGARSGGLCYTCVMGTWKSKNRHKYLLQYHIIFVCNIKKLLVSKQISDDIKQFSYEICQKHKVIIRYMETDKGKRSKNYYKTKKKIALCHEKIRNMRKDYLHKVSHEIISENQVIVSENLQIKNMVKNHHLAKAISDVSWYELTRQLEYKAKWNGRKYIKIDTFYASSQLCSVCGYQNPDTKDLSVRTWICPKCGAEHDRDINAAKNILTEGLRQIA